MMNLSNAARRAASAQTPLARAARLNSGAVLKAASGVFDTPSVSGEVAAKGADAPARREVR